MGLKVPVVTTSTSLAAATSPFFRTIPIISSAVTTTAFPLLIFSFISPYVLLTAYVFISPVSCALPTALSAKYTKSVNNTTKNPCHGS
jgi:hypothetical protein